MSKTRKWTTQEVLARLEEWDQLPSYERERSFFVEVYLPGVMTVARDALNAGGDPVNAVHRALKYWEEMSSPQKQGRILSLSGTLP